MRSSPALAAGGANAASASRQLAAAAIVLPLVPSSALAAKPRYLSRRAPQDFATALRPAPLGRAVPATAARGRRRVPFRRLGALLDGRRAEHARVAVVDLHRQAVHGRRVDPPAGRAPRIDRIPRAEL